MLQAFAVIAAGISFMIALVFSVTKVFNAFFRLFIVAVGFMILAFSTPLETIQEARTSTPIVFFLANALILCIFPLFLAGARSALGSPLAAGDWPYALICGVSLAVLSAGSLGFDIDAFITGLTGIRFPERPESYMGSVQNAWQNLHHVVFSLSSVVPLFRRRGDGPELRILRWAALYTLIVLAASIVLEWIGPRLDLIVTSTLLTATVFAFILFLITRSPALVRDSRIKYGGSKLTPGESTIILERLTRLMEVEKAFKNPDFDLPTAARRIGTSVPNLSQAVNQGMGLNFARMLNVHRVRDAERLLSESDMPVTDVAFEAGFGSLSAFNAIFKADCGLSPSEYRGKRK
jgi:AraC-like DNA-binding protein